MKKHEKYSPSADILRIIAILAVILIHTSTRTLEVSSFDLIRIPQTLFLNQSARFAVHLFFMISGFVLELNYTFHANYKIYLKKRISRIFIPYLFWSLIYYFFVYPIQKVNFPHALLIGDASYQLYFIPSLLIFYIIFPLVHRYYSLLKNRGVLVALGLLQILILYFDYYLKPLPLFLPLRIAFLNYYIFILGAVAADYQNQIMEIVRKWRLLIIFLTFTLPLYIFFEGKSMYLKTHNYLSFYSQWRPSIFFYTLSIAAVLYYIFQRITINPKVIKTFARLSFFVFFIHVLILEIIWGTIGVYFFQATGTRIINHLWYDPLYFLLTASSSFFIAYLAHKIPQLQKLTG